MILCRYIFIRYQSSFSALNTIRPPDLTQQTLGNQQVLPHHASNDGQGSARPVDFIVGADLNTANKISNSDFARPVQQPIVHRGSSFKHEIKSGPTIRPSASPVRYTNSNPNYVWRIVDTYQYVLPL